MEISEYFSVFIWIVILLVWSAFFSGTEVALLSLSKFRIKHLVKNNPKVGGHIENILKEPDRLIGTILVGNNLVNVTGTALATAVAISLFGEKGIIIATLAMTALFLIFSEITPKTYAAYNSTKLSLIVIYPIRVFSIIFYPIVWITTRIANYLLHILGLKEESRWTPITEEEIESLIEVGGAEGAFEPEKKRMLAGVFDLTDLTVKDVMIPMKDVICLESGMEQKHMEKIIVENPYSRYPVYEQNQDHIIGYLHAKEFFKAGISKKFILKDILHPPLFIPETKTIYTQLKDFQKERVHLAFVVDEYGDIRGIITMEDIIEEITGEIYDESDRIKLPYVLQKDGSVLIETDVKTREINRLLNITLPEENSSTLGELILKTMGYIPEKNEKVTINGYQFEISAVKDRSIVKVKMQKKR